MRLRLFWRAGGRARCTSSHVCLSQAERVADFWGEVRRRQAESVKPVVEIATVNVNKCLFHPTPKMQGTSTFRLKPLSRIGRASRVEYSPLDGFGVTLSNRTLGNKKANCEF